MPNVRLRTIINVDNSTTFQVQREDGEWVDLTWEMISDKPFDSLDDTVFTVDENGVLSIISLSTPDWQNIINKPFITLDPSDFTVDNNGVLHYSGSMDWTSLTGKPFSSIDSDDFTVDNNGKLSVIHQNIPNQSWSQISGKPFTSLNDQQFQVIGGTLYLNVATNPQWTNVQNKPFSTLDPNNFTVDNGMLKAIPQTIPDPEWDDVQNKPLSSLNSDDFTVDENGEASVNFPTPTPDSWQDVSSKPFETLNGTDFSVDQDGELSVNFPTPTPDDWDAITSKPFDTLDSPLLSVYQGGLRVYPAGWFSLEMQNAAGTKIASLNDLKRFIEIFIVNTFKYKYSLATPNTGWYCPMCDNNKTININLHIRIDNSQSDLTALSSDYWMTLSFTPYPFGQGPSQDTYIVKIEANGMPAIINSAEARLKINGLLKVFGSKSDGNYTNFKVNNSITDDSFNMYIEEVSKYTSYIQ